MSMSILYVELNYVSIEYKLDNTTVY